MSHKKNQMDYFIDTLSRRVKARIRQTDRFKKAWEKVRVTYTEGVWNDPTKWDHLEITVGDVIQTIYYLRKNTLVEIDIDTGFTANGFSNTVTAATFLETIAAQNIPHQSRFLYVLRENCYGYLYMTHDNSKYPIDHWIRDLKFTTSPNR